MPCGLCGALVLPPAPSACLSPRCHFPACGGWLTLLSSPLLSHPAPRTPEKHPALAGTPGRQRAEAPSHGGAATRTSLRGARSSPLVSPGAPSPHPSCSAIPAGAAHPSSATSSGPIPAAAAPAQCQPLLHRRVHSASSPLPSVSGPGGQHPPSSPSAGPQQICEGSPSKKVCMDPPSALRPALGAGYRQQQQPSAAGALFSRSRTHAQRENAHL